MKNYFFLILLFLNFIFINSSFALNPQEKSKLSQYPSVVGILQGEKDLLVKSRSQGEIKDIFVQVGERVKEGDVLASIENEKEQLELNSAKIDFEQSKKEYENSLKLVKFMSKSELDKILNDYNKKKNIYDLKLYSVNAKKILSPINGIIAKNYLKKGESVNSGEKAFEVIFPDVLEVDLYISAPLAKNLKLGDKLPFVHELDRKNSFWGQISFIGPVIDKASGTIHVKLTLQNGKNFTPGAMVKVFIVSQYKA